MILIACRNFVIDLSFDFSVEIMWWILIAVVLVKAVDWLCGESKLYKAIGGNSG